MPTKLKLLVSKGGSELTPELCLIIAEYAIESEPKVAVTLLSLSKSFSRLLQSYQTSIVKTLCLHDPRLKYVNANQSVVLSSQIPINDMAFALTFKWYSEMRSRHKLIEFLASHDITCMDDDRTNGWPTLDVNKLELRKRQEVFKKQGFCLLYRLADCTAETRGAHRIRASQAKFLENLNEVELSILGCIVEIIGQGFFNMIRKSEPLLAPGTEVSDNEHHIRERMCVFEDRVQKFGPYYVWAYLEGATDRLRRLDLWAQVELQQGLDDMNAFELGITMSYASLQSVVWKVFCRKAGRSLADSWNEARERVEAEMASCKIAA